MSLMMTKRLLTTTTFSSNSSPITQSLRKTISISRKLKWSYRNQAIFYSRRQIFSANNLKVAFFHWIHLLNSPDSANSIAFHFWLQWGVIRWHLHSNASEHYSSDEQQSSFGPTHKPQRIHGILCAVHNTVSLYMHACVLELLRYSYCRLAMGVWVIWLVVVASYLDRKFKLNSIMDMPSSQM